MKCLNVDYLSVCENALILMYTFTLPVLFFTFFFSFGYIQAFLSF